ncbi:MAG TPA: phosphate/phosphite/phosphonate ABC transporter substrate-binding protein [Clostridia bacterium]
MLKRFSALLVAAGILVSAAACSKTDSNPATGDTKAAASESKASDVKKEKVESLVIAYLPNDAKPELAQYRDGLAKDMQTALKDMGVKEVKEFSATDYNAAIEAMRNGKADIVSFGPLSYCQAHQRANAECIVAPALDAKKENCGYYSYIITQAKNDKINSLTDLKGKKFAFVDPDSTSGNLVPSFEILKAFPNDKLTIDDLHTNGKFFESVTFSGSHPNGLQAVSKGDFDAAPCASDVYDRELQNKKFDEKAIKIIFKSPKIMGSPIGVRSNLPDDLKKAIKDFYLKYDNDDYFVKFVGQKPGQKQRYIPVDDSDYQNIYDLMKKFNL